MSKRPLFVHIPRTAGTSIRSVVMAPLPLHEHATLAEWGEGLGDAVFGYEPFCVVRDPLARLVSAWAYLRGQGPGHPHFWRDQGQRCALAQYATIDDAVAGIGAGLLLFPHFAPQFVWVFDEKTGTRCTALKFEQLPDAWRGFAEKHGLQMALPSLNSSVRGGSCRVTDRVKKFAATAYAMDYVWFDYDTDQS